MTKRFRAPKAKPGELKAQYGKLPHDKPDLCFAWGEGVDSADARLLNDALTSKRHRPMANVWDDSLIEELEKRGYDITTLKFSVQKKAIGACKAHRAERDYLESES